MVGINVEAGERCQMGAWSVGLKGSTLDADSIYAGVPARKIDKRTPAAVVEAEPPERGA